MPSLKYVCLTAKEYVAIILPEKRRPAGEMKTDRIISGLISRVDGDCLNYKLSALFEPKLTAVLKNPQEE